MNNPVNYWDPTGNVAELIYPEGFTNIPDWVINFQEGKIEQHFDGYYYRDTWSPLSKEVSYGDTVLVDEIQEARGYLQIYKKTESTSWYYEYSRMIYHIGGAHAEIGGTYGPYLFQLNETAEWIDFLSAEEVAKQNKEIIAKYGAPSNAQIYREVVLPHQYNEYLKKALNNQFKGSLNLGPQDPELKYQGFQIVNITQVIDVNSPVMRDYESSVRAAVEKGEVVRYQSIQIYEGNNLMPKGVTLKARGTNGYSLDVTIINKK